ncbi:hypothetical protein BV360_00960 [Pseudomonas syringae pv. actinidiae]|uniref:DNA-directed RNA polymerase specialized sigma subunit n=1 Tax=Pseudomonas syringae pv. actinidiae TaxID=103796 RepID=A0A2V0QED8_PSESF|nr:hypothetical protein AN901_202461 [Pseudomonas syringae pv. theae]OSN23963.1 hypothetical protein BV339_01006 [Pseudomonas syringae pv. actinidiae]OSN28273.1 hypothetical protein BV341_00955 [Pseudomonas syringae pv. actinidiae]OSN37710.1 hypothetical protein BV343_01025 [Pseudomonas syringae pv. actinidiae]OSN45398.1 hypothetical protein BV344_01028 [Pseudomonas syringae pv. actinidiae]
MSPFGMISGHWVTGSMCIRSGAPHQASGSVDCLAAPVVPDSVIMRAFEVCGVTPDQE